MGPGASGTATLTITAPDGQSRDIEIPAKPGITRYAWAGGMSSGGRGRGGAGAAGGRGGAAGAAGRAGGAGGGGRGGGGGRLEPGTYQLKLTLGSAVSTGMLVVREDPIAKEK
jgi:hypothetical protein